VRRAAFRSLRRGVAAGPAALAREAGLATAVVEEALGALASRGEVELDGDRRVLGSAGLTLLQTRHRLALGGVPLHTWCAIDAIGIPAALEEDALAVTSCPSCGRELRVAFEGGRPTEDPGFVAWLPGEPCRNVREELCPQANLFCGEEHLASWRAGAGEPRGEALGLAQVVALGRRWWGELIGTDERT
jgi:hypothetical protein